MLLVLALSCAPGEVEHYEYEYIATVYGTDFETQVIIEHILGSHGISAGAEGSVLYGVFVEKRNSARAIRILKEALKGPLKGRYVKFREDFQEHAATEE
jgi:hypothetical protein